MSNLHCSDGQFLGLPLWLFHPRSVGCYIYAYERFKKCQSFTPYYTTNLMCFSEDYKAILVVSTGWNTAARECEFILRNRHTGNDLITINMLDPKNWHAIDEVLAGYQLYLPITGLND